MKATLSLLAPPQVRFGIKTGMATVLAYFLTRGLGLEHWQWAVIAGLVAMQGTVADAIQSALNQIIGTILGAVLGIGILYVLPGDMVWLGVALFGGVALASSLSRYSPRFNMASITIAVVLLAGAGQAGPVTDPVGVGLSRMMEISIGVGSAMVISMVVWPVRLADSLRRDLSDQYQRCALFVDTLLSAFINRQKQVDEEMVEELADKTWVNHEQLLHVRKHESMVYQYDHDMLALQVQALDRAVQHLLPMMETLNDYEERGYDVIMAAELRLLADAIMAALRHMGGRTPAAPAPDLIRNLTAMVDRTERRLGQLRDEGAMNRFNLHEIMQFFTFFHALRGMAADLLLALDRMQYPGQK